MNLIRLVKAANAVFFFAWKPNFGELLLFWGSFVNSTETRHPSIIAVAILYMNSNYFAIATCKIQQNDYNNC